MNPLRRARIPPSSYTFLFLFHSPPIHRPLRLRWAASFLAFAFMRRVGASRPTNESGVRAQNAGICKLWQVDRLTLLLHPTLAREYTHMTSEKILGLLDSLSFARAWFWNTVKNSQNLPCPLFYFILGYPRAGGAELVLMEDDLRKMI